MSPMMSEKIWDSKKTWRLRDVSSKKDETKDLQAEVNMLRNLEEKALRCYRTGLSKRPRGLVRPHLCCRKFSQGICAVLKTRDEDANNVFDLMKAT